MERTVSLALAELLIHLKWRYDHRRRSRYTKVQTKMFGDGYHVISTDVVPRLLEANMFPTLAKADALKNCKHT